MEVTKLSWRLYESLKDGLQEFKDLTRDLTTIYGVLDHVRADLESDESAIRAHGEGHLKILTDYDFRTKGNSGRG